MALKIRRGAVPVALIALTFAVVVLLALSTGKLLQSNFDFEQRALRATSLHAVALRLQLDEETSVRGYTATHDASFLRPYREALPQLDAIFGELDAAATNLGVAASTAVASMRSLHNTWLREVAQPLIAGRLSPKSAAALQRRGRDLMDSYRSVNLALSNSLEERIRQHARDASTTFVLLASLAGIAVLLATITLAYVLRHQARLAGTIDRQRRFVEDLQRIYVSRQEGLPRTRTASAYISATREANVGGDFFDVRHLDDEHGYLLVGDVSGKGVPAAVDTAKIRFSVSALAKNASEDPVAILSGLNRVLNTYQSDVPRFASVFYGVLNWKTLKFWYASAGRSTVFLRRGAEVEQLDVTGPIVGIGQEIEITSKEIQLIDSDVLVLATDGLTEARGSGGALLGEDGAMQWLREIDCSDPKACIDELLARLRKYSHSEFRDDLAILVLQIDNAQTERLAPSAPQDGRSTQPVARLVSQT